MVFVRKISENSWFGKESLDSDSLSELTTINHELSVWNIDDLSDETKINDIALALALTRNAVNDFFVVFIDPEKVHKEYNWDLETLDEEGITGFEAMKDKHTNCVILSLWHQGFLAEHIHNLIQDNQNYRYYDVTTLVDLLHEAVINGRIDRNILKRNYGKWNKKLDELELLKAAS